jgi:Na+/H+ antiporter NhaD/arsenite permease-like protein
MVLFVGNPTNVVICEGFAVNNVGFTAYTILPFLGCSLSCFIALAIQFRHVKYVPRKVNVAGDLDVSAVLRDPIGACVGGVLLGTCLIIIIIVSFFKVEVWMISLPCAVAKFLWDLAWDTCGIRYLNKGGKEDKSNVDEEDKDVMLSELKRRKTHPTTNAEGFDLNPKPETEIANGVASGIANGHIPNSAKPKAEVVNGVASGTANGHIPNSAEPILSPAATFYGPSPTPTFNEQSLAVTFDEPLPIPSTGALRSDTPKTFQSLQSPSSAASRSDTLKTLQSQESPSSSSKSKSLSSFPLLSAISDLPHRFSIYLSNHFPTFHTALPRLPFALVPFAFSQFILIEALSRQGWINIFAHWLVVVTKREIFKTVWVVGVLGVLLCNASGTNIGATILLTKIVNTAASSYVPPSSGPEVNIKAFLRSAAIALAVASNIGAVSFTFSASLAGLLWRQILLQKKIIVAQTTFAKWNLGPIIVMTAVGLAVVTAEMAVLY